MIKGTNDQPGDMRFDEDGEVLVFDGENWGPYLRVPVPGSGTVFREGRLQDSTQRAEPHDESGENADE